MRDTITVNGVQLTRKQVEEAYSQLQTEFMPGDHVLVIGSGFTGVEFVVGSPSVRLALAAANPTYFKNNEMALIDVWTGRWISESASRLHLLRRPTAV